MSKPKSINNFYTSREAAKLLGVSTTTIQLWVEAGILPAWKTAGGHRRIPREAVEKTLVQQQKGTPQEPVRHDLSVLIVEDEPVQREIYRLKFEEWSLPVSLYLAQDGFEGLVMAGKYSPELVITDLSMPNMNGFEMIRRLQESKEIATPLLMVVSALSNEEINAFGSLPEDIPIYSKPFPLAALKPIVESVLYNNTATSHT